MRKLYVHKTTVGAFYIAEQDGKFHAVFRDESLGSYATSQEAVDSVAGGNLRHRVSEVETAALAIPHRLQGWARLVF